MAACKLFGMITTDMDLQAGSGQSGAVTVYMRETRSNDAITADARDTEGHLSKSQY